MPHSISLAVSMNLEHSIKEGSHERYPVHLQCFRNIKKIKYPDFQAMTYCIHFISNRIQTTIPIFKKVDISSLKFYMFQFTSNVDFTFQVLALHFIDSSHIFQMYYFVEMSQNFSYYFFFQFLRTVVSSLALSLPLVEILMEMKLITCHVHPTNPMFPTFPVSCQKISSIV